MVVATAALSTWIPAFGCEWVGCDPSAGDLGAVLARCVRTEGDVRYHSEAALVWNALEVGMGLGAGAWVKTADESTAELELERGGTLFVSAGSTVVIEAPEHDDEDTQTAGQISVVRGRIRARVASDASRQRLFIRSQRGRRLRVSPLSPKVGVSYELSADGQGGVELKVTTGEARVVSDEGHSIDVASGEMRALLGGPNAHPDRDGFFDGPGSQADGEAPANMDPNADLAGDPARSRLASIEDRLQSPKEDAVVGFSGASPTLSFAWNAWGAKEGKEGKDGHAEADHEHEYEYEVVIARDEALKEVVQTLSTRELRARTRTVGPGEYFWGVFVQHDGAREALQPKGRRLIVRRGRVRLRTPGRLSWD